MELSFQKHSKIIFSIALFSLVMACNRPPDLPIEPNIGFNKVEFKEEVEVIGSTGVEIRTGVLSLSFNISDGDGDIGLDGDEVGPDYDFITYPNGQIVQFGERPEDPPFTCIDYVREADQADGEGNLGADLNGNGNATDTLRIELNEDRFNFFIDFFVKKNGTFQEIDFRKIPESANGITLCGEIPFDSRIPCLSKEGKPCSAIPTNPGPIEGVIKYDMKSGIFLPVFRTDTIKVVFQIQDRAKHRSNIVESPEFTLQSAGVDQP
ncbi:hypothetical protein [uncultured Roseivirga sp.]|uniref:hypothetical protein n=1 Tax=uncultured Roseivirga sp. TaxID=543088 RepID=UPI0030DBFACB|tara:strand:+ start:2563 stop:3357 length:795 start_codon:yes stop_codon:yes gene_type:complete